MANDTDTRPTNINIGTYQGVQNPSFSVDDDTITEASDIEAQRPSEVDHITPHTVSRRSKQAAISSHACRPIDFGQPCMN